MWARIFRQIWRKLPKKIRRLAVVLFHPRFTVATGALIINSKNQLLLLHHQFRPGSSWGLPGGFINTKEDPESGLRRELKEEINLEIVDLEIALTRTLNKYKQVEIYYRGRTNIDVFNLSFEINRAEWFDLDRLPADLCADQRWLIEMILPSHLSLPEKCGRREVLID